MNIMAKLRTYSFWVSILLHIVLLLLFTVFITWNHKEKKHTVPPYVPAYTYTPKVSSYKAPTQPSQPQQAAKKTTELMPPKKDGSIMSAKKARIEKTNFSQSLLAASLTSLKQEQMNSLAKSTPDEPALLIGDMSQESDPLIKLMGHSLSAHFRYPDTEGRLGIKGKVLIGLTLYPDGHFGDIKIVQSSNNHNFDSAALYASNTAPTIYGVDRFISQPKHFVIGFIFN